jgi:hypothetical protein
MARDVQTLRTARSNDGTAIAFERGGDGPALILLGGALSAGLRNFPPFVAFAGDELATGSSREPRRPDGVELVSRG